MVEDKAPRAQNYHDGTIKSFLELIAAAGLNGPEQLSRQHISKRVGSFDIKTYDEIYPYLEENCLLNENTIPEEYKRYFNSTRLV